MRVLTHFWNKLKWSRPEICYENNNCIETLEWINPEKNPAGLINNKIVKENEQNKICRM